MEDVRFEQVTYGPALWAVGPAIAFLVLVVLIIRHELAAHSANHHLKLTTLLWTLPHLGLLAGAAGWYCMGAGSSNIICLAVFCLACLMFGRLTLHRDDRFPPLPVLLVTTTVCGVLALELCRNEKIYTMMPLFALLETLLVGGLLCGLWLLCGKRGIGPAIGLIALTAVGIVEHYVLEFRGTAILPSDIYAMGTALSVSGGYTYDLSWGMLLGLAALSAGLSFCSLLWRGVARQVRLLNLAGGVVVLGLTAALVLIPSYGDVFGAQIDYWWSKDWYGRQGFLPSFIYAWQDLAIREPDGYSEDTARAAQTTLAQRHLEHEGTAERRAAATEQFARTAPNIIVIQNETFCDLSVFDHLRNGYDGPAFWNTGLTDALARGELAVSVFGGGTCNTEFEFLTSNSLAFVGASKYPFTMYDLSTCDSLPRQLAAAGYRTVGMHPNIASNWNRDRAYEQLGFQEFLDETAFKDAELYHTHVSDWATYERSLDLLRSTDAPTFVFDVTMQNHSGYDTGSIPADQLRNYHIDGLSEDDTFQLNEFLACIDESDRALQRLVEELRGLGEPTVVVMYGDHHPWFSQAINDLIYPDEDALAHAERTHNTCYVMWANYEVAGGIDEQADGGNTSADLLSAMMLDAIGAPTSEFQQALIGARQEVRSVNANGYLGTDGVWHPLAEVPSELALVEYLNFGSTV